MCACLEVLLYTKISEELQILCNTESDPHLHLISRLSHNLYRFKLLTGQKIKGISHRKLRPKNEASYMCLVRLLDELVVVNKSLYLYKLSLVRQLYLRWEE